MLSKPATTVRRDIFLIICASVFWGTVGVANQAIYDASVTNALSLAFWRLGIATPIFVIAALRLPGRSFREIKLPDLGIMLLMGALQGLYQACYSGSIPYIGVTIATLIA